jgi:hypothetical protein
MKRNKIKIKIKIKIHQEKTYYHFPVCMYSKIDSKYFPLQLMKTNPFKSFTIGNLHLLKENKYKKIEVRDKGNTTQERMEIWIWTAIVEYSIPRSPIFHSSNIQLQNITLLFHGTPSGKAKNTVSHWPPKIKN